MEYLKELLSSSSFMPHGHCYLWRPDILWLNVGSDALIALAYFTIPGFLIYFVKKRHDVVFNWIFVMFAMFIVACGTTHLVEIWTVWNPQYGLQGIVKFLAATISLATAFALYPLMPKALALPSADQIEETNRKLLQEVEERKARAKLQEVAEENLRTLYCELERRIEERTAELKQANATLLQSEAELAKHAERLASVVDHVVDGIITINARFEIESWNPAARKIFGYEAEEVIGRNVRMLMPEPYHGQHDAYIGNYLRTGHAKVIGIGREVVGRRKDGSEFPMDLAVSEFSLGNQRYFTGIVRDITERKRFERSLRETAEDLRAARDAAESANQAKSAFLANMSHEIRTPLGAVLGFAELLVSPETSASEKNDYMAAVKRNGELLSTIINDILDLSKVEAGKMEMEMQETTLTEILTDLTTLLQLQAMEKGVVLTVTPEGPVPHTIMTDPIRLRQILLNIVGNAIKFTQRGTVDVTLKLVHSADGSSHLCFTVKDTGPGIAKEQQERLFEPFSQADASTKRKFGGTGLGLVLAKRLARLLGGDVDLVESTLGVGSVFRITVDPGPLRKSAYQSFSAQNRSAGPDGETAGHKISLDGIKVLLADDALDNQMLVSRLLKIAGATVATASNGQEALERAYEDKYHVLLMDLQMPVMDGYEATAALRRVGFDTPIIALTAHALKEERQRCLNSGFNDHLSKPINRYALLETVAYYAARVEGH